MAPPPKALMSYTQFDDEYSKGHLTALRDRLSTTMRALTGEEFMIFQPHQDVQWGQRPDERIRAALAQVYLFIPVITPSYFNDKRCREELTLFLERERALGRGELILPVLYLPTPKLDNPGDDALVQVIGSRTPVDWNRLRHAALDSPEVTETIEQMATHVVAALGRAMTAPPPPAQRDTQRAERANSQHPSGGKVRIEQKGSTHLRIYGMPSHRATVEWLYDTVNEIIQQQRDQALGEQIDWHGGLPLPRADVRDMTVKMSHYKYTADGVQKYGLPIDAVRFQLKPLDEETRVDITWMDDRASHLVKAIEDQIIQHWPQSHAPAQPLVTDPSLPATPPAPPPLTDEQRHQTDLLRRNLQRFISVEKQLVQHSGDITLQIDRERTVEAINQSAAALGLGTYPDDVAALIQAAGLHAEYTAFLEHQRQALVEYQHRLKLNEVSASATARVNIQMQLDDVAQRLREIERQQADLISHPVRTPAPTATAQTEAESGRLHAPMLPLVDAQRLLYCADSIAQVKVGQFVRGKLEGGRVTGTAWLIAPDLALTCWHVLHARHPDDEAARAADVDIQAENCLLTFNFTEIGAGIDYAVERLECADRNSYGLDYALLRLRNRDDRPLQARAPLTFDTDTPLRQISELYIIQHPRGMQQYGADGHFVAYANQSLRMHYTNNTAAGTSGSPVLLRPYWRVVALHHGATRDRLHGEGIALRPILDDIKRQQPDIYTEIMRAQPAR